MHWRKVAARRCKMRFVKGRSWRVTAVMPAAVINPVIAGKGTVVIHTTTGLLPQCTSQLLWNIDPTMTPAVKLINPVATMSPVL